MAVARPLQLALHAADLPLGEFRAYYLGDAANVQSLEMAVRENAGAALRQGRVRQVLQQFEPDPYGVYALYPHNRHLAAKVRALVDFLADRYRNSPPWELDS